MKIVVAHTFYQQPGGEDTVFFQEVSLLRRGGHDVVTYTRSNCEIDRYGVGGKLMLIPNTVWSSSSRTDFGAMLDRERPDLVHFHNTFMVMSPSVYAACNDRHIPVVQTLHNYRLACPGASFFRDGAPCEDCVTKTVWNGVLHGCYRGSRAATATVAAMVAVNRALGIWTSKVDRFIALSNFARRKLKSCGIPEEKILLKPNFVSPDPGARTRIGAHAIFVGRLVAEKGLRTLLRAWEGLEGELPLHLVGGGPQRPNMEELVRTHHIKGVVFAGHLPRPEALDQIRSARFLIFPSESYENFPMSVVEAYACGVPVIAAKVGSTAEIVHDGITGMTFTPGDPKELLQRVKWAIEHPDLLEEMGRRARTEFEVKYTEGRNYGMLMNIYESALADRHAESSVVIPEVA